MVKEKSLTQRRKDAESKEKLKTCIDCFNCKVAKVSTQECRLCFCSAKKKSIIHQDIYWLKKAVCTKFKGFSA